MYMSLAPAAILRFIGGNRGRSGGGKWTTTFHTGETAVVIATLSSGKLGDGNLMQPTGQHVERPGPILGN